VRELVERRLSILPATELDKVILPRGLRVEARLCAPRVRVQSNLLELNALRLGYPTGKAEDGSPAPYGGSGLVLGHY
jgi:hypothetical protein